MRNFRNNFSSLVLFYSEEAVFNLLMVNLLYTMVFDYRFWGGSEGGPRNQVFASEMVDDYRNAITWLSKRPEVNSDRIGIWGTSYSGGLCLYVGIHDKRVKAVVAQVPSTLNPESRSSKAPDTWNLVGESLINDRIQRYETSMISIVKGKRRFPLSLSDALQWP